MSAHVAMEGSGPHTTLSSCGNGSVDEFSLSELQSPYSVCTKLTHVVDLVRLYGSFRDCLCGSCVKEACHWSAYQLSHTSLTFESVHTIQGTCICTQKRTHGGRFSDQAYICLLRRRTVILQDHSCESSCFLWRILLSYF